MKIANKLSKEDEGRILNMIKTYHDYVVIVLLFVHQIQFLLFFLPTIGDWPDYCRLELMVGLHAGAAHSFSAVRNTKRQEISLCAWREASH